MGFKKTMLMDWEFSEEVVLAQSPTAPNLKRFHYETTLPIANISKDEQLLFIDIFNTLPPFKLYINGVCLEETGKTSDQFTAEISSAISESDSRIHIKISLIATELIYGKELIGHVFLRIEPQIYIKKVSLMPRLKNGNSELDITISANTIVHGEVIVELLDGDDVIATIRRRTSGKDIDVKMRRLDVSEWRCETPTLYTVKIILLEIDSSLFWEQQVGFSKTVIKQRGDDFLLGDMVVDLDKLYHRNNYPYWGNCGSKEMCYAIADRCYFMKDDYPVIKLSGHSLESHFLDRCDQLGIPVILELLPLSLTQKSIIKILRKLKRTVNLYEHHPSIVAWALPEKINAISELNLLNIIKEMDSERPIILLKTSATIDENSSDK